MKENASKPLFAARPPDGVEEEVWKVLRVAPKAVLKGVILSHNLIGTFTHYYRGSSRPCPPQGICEACDANYRRDWHSWFAAWSPESGNRVIVEITLKAVTAYDAFFRKHRTLRGAKFAMHRVPARANGKLFASLTEGDLPTSALPKDADIVKHLLRMWGYSLDKNPAELFGADDQQPAIAMRRSAP